MPLIDAYRKDTGEKVQVPSAWIGHPAFPEFAKTPRQKAADRQKAAEKAATTETPAAGDKKE